MRKDLVVFHEKGKFAAWPAGGMCKNWGDEILCAYYVAEYLNTERGHHFKRDGKAYHYMSRSLDKGLTWTSKPVFLKGTGGSEPHMTREMLKDLDCKVDFTNPDLCLFFDASGMRNTDFSWWYYSTDRGNTWNGPFKFPKIEGLSFDLNMRTAYTVLNKDEILIYCTTQKSTEREGNTFCAKLKDGGMSIELLCQIGPEFPDNGYMIMPQALRRKDGTLVCLIRTQETVSVDLNPRGEIYYITQYESTDNGLSWQYKGNPVSDHGGNPPAPAIMKDGTWVLVYGYRKRPFGIRCKYSEDEGKTWSEEIVLRDDAFTADVGYPRITALEDGSVFVCYYIGTKEGEEQHIEATILDKEFLKTGK